MMRLRVPSGSERGKLVTVLRELERAASREVETVTAAVRGPGPGRKWTRNLRLPRPVAQLLPVTQSRSLAPADVVRDVLHLVHLVDVDPPRNQLAAGNCNGHSTY
jgi:hypothetical protein